MWINKTVYENQIKLIESQSNKIKQLRQIILEKEEDSGEAIIDKLSELARKAKIDVHGPEYQTLMHRVFMDIAGRHSPVAKAYSSTAFLKDNPEELLKRMKEFQRDASIVTKKLEGKSK